jgi:hypothetical protein
MTSSISIPDDGARVPQIRDPHEPPRRGRHRVTDRTQPQHLARTLVAARAGSLLRRSVAT